MIFLPYYEKIDTALMYKIIPFILLDLRLNELFFTLIYPSNYSYIGHK